MTTRGRLLGWLLLGLLGGVLGQGCGSSETRPPRKPASAAGTGGKDGMTVTVEPAGGQGGNGGISPYDELCGIRTEGCVPDESTNDLCKPSIGSGPSPLPGGGRSTGGGGGKPSLGQSGELAASGVGAAAGELGNAGYSGAPGGQGGEAPGQAGAAGAPGSMPDNGGNEAAGGEAGHGIGGVTVAGRSGQGGVAGTAPASAGTAGLTVSTLSLTSCQVTEDPKHRGRPVAQCLPAGNGIEGGPCFSGSDCRAGLACVGDGPGQCRPYCCNGDAGCRDRTHCSAEPLLVPTAKATLEVPVCMPVVNCSLAEPPCMEGATCSCPVGSACVVVGSDGTTSCVNMASLPPPDEGIEGLPCPCGWGFVCSQASNTCVKLCQTGAPDLYCGGARCQPGTTLPLGWGTCVGVPPKGSSLP
jgi:hypothetical protein